MLGEFPRYTRHVLGGPCEDVPILTEEVDELAFLFAAQVAADCQELLFRPARIQRDLLAVLGRLELHLASWPLCSRASGGSVSTTRLISLNSSTMVKDSAILEPAEAHAMDRL